MSLLVPVLTALVLAAEPVPPRGLPPEDVLDTWDEHAEDVEIFLKKRWCGAINADARQLELRRRLLAQGRHFVSSTEFRGRRWLRLALMSPATGLEEVERLIEALRAAAAEVP